MGFLNISNLTLEMSGLYTANIKFYSGQYQKKDFKLCVYGKVWNIPNQAFWQSPFKNKILKFGLKIIHHTSIF